MNAGSKMSDLEDIRLLELSEDNSTFRRTHKNVPLKQTDLKIGVQKNGEMP
jgi:hypothetical protein